MYYSIASGKYIAGLTKRETDILIREGICAKELLELWSNKPEEHLCIVLPEHLQNRIRAICTKRAEEENIRQVETDF